MNVAPHATAGQVDPRDLTTAELAALRLTAENRLRRARNGWRGMGKAVVTLKMAERLQAKRLVERRYERAAFLLVVTGIGRYTLAVADARRRA